MTYLTLAKNRAIFGKRKRTVSLKFKPGPYTLMVVVVVLICLISLFFLAQVFQASTQGFEISNLQEQIEELKEKNRALEVKSTELRSFEKIKKEAEKLNMVKTDKVVYLRSDGKMAAAR